MADQDFQPILHHHDPSPFGEKIRKAFGIKGIAWRSVQIPMVMPKPDLTLLTGGYRGTPVMQVGADIYCDTRRIIEIVENAAPSPTLFPGGPTVPLNLQHWSDEAWFPCGAALAMFEGADQIPADVLQDREHYFQNLDFTRFAENAPFFRSQVRAHAALIDRHLSGGARFLTGDHPSWSDINAWFNVWMIRRHVPSGNRLLEALQHLEAWEERMARFETGQRTEISSETAIDMASEASPKSVPAPRGDRETALTPGTEVVVVPRDHPDITVFGHLLHAADDTIIIARDTPRTGPLAVHFPRIGYQIRAV